MIVLDASAAIALLDGHDAHHDEAVRLLAAAVESDLSISPVTLAEVLVGPTRSAQADRVLRDFEGLEVRQVPFGGDAPSRLAALRVETRLKLPDCCVLLAAEDGRASEIMTFDEKLATVARERGFDVLERQKGPAHK